MTATEIPTRNIPAGQLRKPRYQREESEQFIRHWTKYYDEKLVGTLTVSERDEGLFYVIDGWHRRQITMGKFGPDHEMKCEVHTGLSEQDEAEMFDSLDTQRRKLAPRDRFAGRLRMGGLAEKDIVRILEKYGVGVVLSKSGGPGKEQTGAHQTLYEVYGVAGNQWHGSPDLLDRVMRVCTGTYGPEGGTYGQLLKAFAILFRARPGVNDKDLMQKLAKFGTFYALLGSVKGAVSGGGGGPMLVANQMLNIYNVRRTTHKIPLIEAGDLRKARDEAARMR